MMRRLSLMEKEDVGPRLRLDTESGPAPSPRRPWPGSQRRRNGRCFPAGLIKQCILEDTNPASIWDRDHTACFNVQILNSGNRFSELTGTAPPSTPVFGPRPTPMRGLPSVNEPDKIEKRKGTGMESARTKSDDALEQNKKAQGFSDNEDEDDMGEQEHGGDSDGKNRAIVSMVTRTITKTKEQPSRNPIRRLDQFTPVSEPRGGAFPHEVARLQAPCSQKGEKRFEL
ncbi:MAG: hypothetical protein Q9161_007578 [Pseudevernia consocians]